MPRISNDDSGALHTGAAWFNPWTRIHLDPKEPGAGDLPADKAPDLGAQMDERIAAHMAPINKALSEQSALLASLKGLIPDKKIEPAPKEKSGDDPNPEIEELRKTQKQLSDELTKERSTRRDAEKARIIAEGFRGVNFLGTPHEKSVLRDAGDLIQYDEKENGFFAEIEKPIAPGSRTLTKQKIPAAEFIKMGLGGELWNWAIAADTAGGAGAKGGKSSMATLPASYEEATSTPGMIEELARNNPEHLNRIRAEHKKEYGWKPRAAGARN